MQKDTLYPSLVEVGLFEVLFAETEKIKFQSKNLKLLF